MLALARRLQEFQKRTWGQTNFTVMKAWSSERLLTVFGWRNKPSRFIRTLINPWLSSGGWGFVAMGSILEEYSGRLVCSSPSFVSFKVPLFAHFEMYLLRLVSSERFQLAASALTAGWQRGGWPVVSSTCCFSQLGHFQPRQQLTLKKHL